MRIDRKTMTWRHSSINGPKGRDHEANMNRRERRQLGCYREECADRGRRTLVNIGRPTCGKGTAETFEGEPDDGRIRDLSKTPVSTGVAAGQQLGQIVEGGCPGKNRRSTRRHKAAWPEGKRAEDKIFEARPSLDRTESRLKLATT